MGTQFTSYDQVGAKEDVSDIITDITPTKVPFQSMIGSDPVKNKVFDWQEDSLRAVIDNAKSEGFTAAVSTRAPTALRENVTQIISDTFEVSGTADAISTYGRAKESAYQVVRVGKELKRDLENAFVGTGQAKVKPTDNTTIRKMAGYQAQIDASKITATGGGNNLTEAALLINLQALSDAGSDPTMLMLTSSNSLKMADFAKASGRYRTFDSGNSRAANTTVVNAVNLYVSPFGEQKVAINIFQKAGDTLVFDPAMWKKATLRAWFRETLAKVGDKTTMMLVGEFSLKHLNFNASGIVRDGA